MGRGRLVATAVAGVAILGALAGAAAAAPAVGGAVQVTSTPVAARGPAVPVVAVDPGNDDVVVVAEGETRSSKCLLHVSTDGGASWRDAASPQPAEAPRCVRNTEGPIADLTFGPDGVLYYAFPGWKLDDWHSQIYLARSTDLGATWDTVGLGGHQPDFARGWAGSNALPVSGSTPSGPAGCTWPGAPTTACGTWSRSCPPTPTPASSSAAGPTWPSPTTAAAPSPGPSTWPATERSR